MSYLVSPAVVPAVGSSSPVGSGSPLVTASSKPSVSVVIPTLNEARNLPWVLARIPQFVSELIIVDGHSSDQTVQVARAVRADVVVVVADQRGKGAAIRAGFAAATGDLIVMLDADGSMDPAEIGRYAALLCSSFDLVKGSRYLAGGASDDLTRLRDYGNRVLTHLANTACHSHFSDLCYGYVGLRRQCLPLLELASDGFEIETQLVVRAVRAGLRIAEVPSHERDRLSGASHLRTFRDGFRVLHTLGREWSEWEPSTAGAPAEALRRVSYQLSPDEGTRGPADPTLLLTDAAVA